MKRKLAAALLLASIALPVQFVQATLRPLPQSNEQHTIVLKLSDLRSAYLQRAGIVRYDQSKHSPEGLRQQLQRHFDVVIGLLLVSTPRSIETAIVRLESADGRIWSTGERADQRKELLAMRYLQLRRLAAYRDRGQFPLNEGQSAQAVPIFVDRHDTACAVGHLMRVSGYREDVARIQSTNNLVYVPDAKQSEVTAWALTSGLTWEEAALIQPAYGSFYAPYYMVEYELGESSLVKNGLKYENFHFEAQNFTGSWTSNGFFFHSLSRKDSCGTEDFEACAPTGGNLPHSNSIGFNAGADLLFGYTFPFPGFTEQFDPIGTHWISIGGDSLGPGVGLSRYINGSAPSTLLQRIRLSFDVSTLDSSTFINQIAEHSYYNKGGFSGAFSTTDHQFEFTTKAFVGGTLFGSTFLKEDPSQPYSSLSNSAELIAPTNHLTVSTTIWLHRGAIVNGYVLGFNVIPEPQTLTLLIVAAFAVALRYRRIPQYS